MNARLKNFTIFSLIGLVLTLSTAANAQIRAYRVTDRQVQTLLDRIETRSNAFRNEIDRSLDRSNIDGTDREDSINNLIANYETATDSLRNNFSSRQSTSEDVQEVLNRAVFVNAFMRNNRVSLLAQNQWTLLRTDLNTLGGYYRVSSNWNAPVISPTVGQNVYNVSDTQLRDLLTRIETTTNTLQRQIDRRLDRSPVDGTNREDSINAMIAKFETATDTLRSNFTSRRSTTADVQEVLNRAVGVNNFVRNNRLPTSAQNSWNQIRADLDTLAGYYRVASNWNTTVVPEPQFGGFDARLTGTYRLNKAQSDDLTTVIDRAIVNANYNENQQERLRRTLERRLLSPETLSIEKRGQQVMLSSANASRVTLDADGVARSETSANGRTVRTSVTATNRDVTINYEGDRTNDYYVSFMPTNNGQLRVTRRVYLENQNDQVTVMSVYDKTGQSPQWNITADIPPNTGDQPVAGGFIIPNNTGIVATLDTPLSTKVSQNGDRFSMTVTSPSQYRGAVIEGRVVADKSGVV